MNGPDVNMRHEQRGGFQSLRERLGGQQGATAVEYAIMVTLIAVVVIAAVAFVGVSLRSDFECSGSAIEAMPSAPPCTP